MKVDKMLFFNIHSWIGVKFSILFFVACFSGTLATISNEMDWLFSPEIGASDTGELANKNTKSKMRQKLIRRERSFIGDG